ncbi:MAG: hypothetical protein JNM18_21365 [Planctomycetaceae bacterium]|nr:hypothetical protein [Planctomycetaceae bacterium]
MQEEFPFLPEEWEMVRCAGSEIVNVTAMEDDLLHTIKLDALLDILAMLREKYDDHPVLLETEADFTEEAQRRIELYMRALDDSIRRGFPTYAIRLSLVDCLLEQAAESRAGTAESRATTELALEHLKLCEQEVLAHGDELDRANWERLRTLSENAN